MDKRLVTVALIGMGGYGNNYVKEILDNCEEYGIYCVAMADAVPENCQYYNDVVKRGIPIYYSIEELYEEHSPQLVFIATPIQLHCRHICYALKHGSCVLCEKPIAATVADAKQIIDMAKKKGKFVAIGYQRSYNRAVLRAKEDILAGKYGKPVKFKCIVMWRRPIAYFQRAWAGKIKLGEDFVYDSVANNACAHFLHNLFFMAGNSIDTSAYPESIEAECYRVNDIENYDTITARIITTNGVDLYFAATHCAEYRYDPYSVCEFEKGTIVFEQDGRIVGNLKNGEVIEYGDSKAENFRKIPCIIDAVRGQKTLFCDVNTALPHSITIQYIQDNVQIQDLSNRAELLNVSESGEVPKYMKYVRGLGEAMLECFCEEKMLSMKI